MSLTDPVEGSIVINVSVCLSVCGVGGCLSTTKLTMQIFCARCTGSVLLRRRCNVLRTSSFVDDVILALMSLMAQAMRAGCNLKVTRYRSRTDLTRRRIIRKLARRQHRNVAKSNTYDCLVNIDVIFCVEILQQNKTRLMRHAYLEYIQT